VEGDAAGELLSDAEGEPAGLADAAGDCLAAVLDAPQAAIRRMATA
jgi:hypothetical protein